MLNAQCLHIMCKYLQKKMANKSKKKEIKRIRNNGKTKEMLRMHISYVSFGIEQMKLNNWQQQL